MEKRRPLRSCRRNSPPLRGTELPGDLAPLSKEDGSCGAERGESGGTKLVLPMLSHSLPGPGHPSPDKAPLTVVHRGGAEGELAVGAWRVVYSGAGSLQNSRCHLCEEVLKNIKNLIIHHRRVHSLRVCLVCGVCDAEYNGYSAVGAIARHYVACKRAREGGLVGKGGGGGRGGEVINLGGTAATDQGIQSPGPDRGTEYYGERGLNPGGATTSAPGILNPDLGLGGANGVGFGRDVEGGRVTGREIVGGGRREAGGNFKLLYADGAGVPSPRGRRGSDYLNDPGVRISGGARGFPEGGTLSSPGLARMGRLNRSVMSGSPAPSDTGLGRWDDAVVPPIRGTPEPRKATVVCPECGRRFRNNNGLGLHRKNAHPIEFNLGKAQPKRVAYTKEEMAIIARAEGALMALGGKIFIRDIINALPVGFLTGRENQNYERVKSIRRTPSYSEMLRSVQSGDQDRGPDGSKAALAPASHGGGASGNLEADYRRPTRQTAGRNLAQVSCRQTRSKNLEVRTGNGSGESPTSPHRKRVVPEDDDEVPFNSLSPNSLNSLTTVGTLQRLLTASSPSEWTPSSGEAGSDQPSLLLGEGHVQRGGRGDPDPSEPSSPGSSNGSDEPRFGNEGEARHALWEDLRALTRDGGDALVTELNQILARVPPPNELTEALKASLLDDVEGAMRRHRPALFVREQRRAGRPGRQRNPPIDDRRLSRRERKRIEYARTQRAFNRDPKELANKLINDGEDGAEGRRPTVAQFVEEFRPRFAAISPPDNAPYVQKPNIQMIQVIRFITGQDILGALKGTGKTGAGPENPKMDSAALRRLGTAVLTRIYNLWLYIGRVPVWTTLSRTAMLPKKGDLANPTNWRPITIGSHILRVYTKIIATRLSDLADLDPRQKAFRHVDGCGENACLVEGIIRDARLRRKNMSMCFIDIAKAFDTVSHESITRALKRLDTPEHIINLIGDLYSGATTRIIVSGEESVEIPITRGVKQGCPLSPFLFSALMDEFIGSVGGDIGYQFSDGVSVAVVAFADDLVLTSASKPGMVYLLDLLDRFLAARGLTAHPGKCAGIILERPGGRRGGIRVETNPGQGFTLLDPNTGVPAEFPLIHPDQYVRYLGLDVGPSGLRRPGREVRQERAWVLGILGRIGLAKLKPLQKLSILVGHFIPKMTYRYVKGSCNLNLLLALDKVVRRAVREWMHLPHSIPNSLLHLAARDGGLGLPSLTEAVSIQKMRLHAILVTSRDAAVRSAAAFPLWGREVGGMARHFGVGVVDRRSVRQLEKDLKVKHQNAWANTWHGSGAQAFFNSPDANAVLSDMGGRGRLPLDLLRLRAQTVSCKISRAIGRIPVGQLQGLVCGRCGEGQEDVMHILQTCPSLRHNRTRRHDELARIIAKWCREDRHTVIEEPRIPVGHTFIKPDFIIRVGDEIRVVDLCVPYETGGNALERAERAKEIKYRQYDDAIKRFVGGHEALREARGHLSYHGIALGARGGIRPATKRFLRSLGVRAQGARRLCRMAVERSITMIRLWGRL